MSDNSHQDLRDEHSARPSAQDARQGRNGPQILIVLCTSVGLLASAYVAMLVFAGG
jgi:hypothetical protein